MGSVPRINCHLAVVPLLIKVTSPQKCALRALKQRKRLILKNGEGKGERSPFPAI